MLNEKDKKYLREFGENLKAIRTAKNLTQQNLADILEVEISQVSRIERGKINTSVINLKKIAIALEIDAGDLFKF